MSQMTLAEIYASYPELKHCDVCGRLATVIGRDDDDTEDLVLCDEHGVPGEGEVVRELDQAEGVRLLYSMYQAVANIRSPHVETHV